MSGLRVPSTDGKENRRVLFEEYTESNDVEPTLVTDPGVSTGSIVMRCPATNEGGIFIGWGEDVTLENGYPLYARDGLGIDLDVSVQDIYAVADTAADELRILTTN